MDVVTSSVPPELEVVEVPEAGGRVATEKAGRESTRVEPTPETTAAAAAARRKRDERPG